MAGGQPLNGLSRVEANGVDALEKSKWIAMLQNKVGRLGRAGLLITLLIPTAQLDAAQAEPPLTLSATAPEHYTVAGRRYGMGHCITVFARAMAVARAVG